MTETDPLSAVLAEKRAVLAQASGGGTFFLTVEAARGRLGRVLPVTESALDALDAVLGAHRPGTRVLYGPPCGAHRGGSWGAGRSSCPDCHPEFRAEVCPECRDESGDPVPFGDCRARKAALGALNGGTDHGN